MTRISAIVRADPCGLSTLSRMFSDFLPGGFHRTLSIAHHRGECYPQWFDRSAAGNRHIGGAVPTLADIDWLCQGADILLSFETWYSDNVPARAHQLGVKTALTPMYECCPQRGFGLPDTDLLLCPTELEVEEMAHNTPAVSTSRTKILYLPIPCDCERIEFRRRECVETFVHNAGHGGSLGRNSTQEVLDAWKYVESSARLLVRMQPGMHATVKVPSDKRITAIEMNTENYWDLWNEGEVRQVTGDVMLHPSKFDALSLPINEALTSGMPTVVTRYWPMCDEASYIRAAHPGLISGYLPAEIQSLALPVLKTRDRTICREFTSYETTPKEIAARVDGLYGTDVSAASEAARRWAEARSWEAIGEKWRQTIDELAATPTTPG